MKISLPLLSSWASYSKDSNSLEDVPNCLWHVVDDRACVYEQSTNMGPMISWFQYWGDEGGIWRYPLSQPTRLMFSKAEYVPITLENGFLMLNGYKMNPVSGLVVPERFDSFPGTRLDQDGRRVPHTNKAALQEYLPELPKGDQGAAGHALGRSTFSPQFL